MKDVTIKRKETYERMAVDFKQDRQLTGYHHFRRLEIILSLLNKLGENLLILDAGCGDGLQMELYSQSHRVVGMDIAFTRLKRAKERVKKNAVFQGDLFKLPLKEGRCDLVILGEVLEHLEEPEVVLREIYRILKPSGHIILDTPSQSNIVDIILKLFGIKPQWGYKVDTTHLWFFTMNQVVALLKNAGYTIAKIKGGSFIRYDLPIIHHCTWVKKRRWVYRLFDCTVGKLPLLKRLGAIQVFMAKKVSTGRCTVG